MGRATTRTGHCRCMKCYKKAHEFLWNIDRSISWHDVEYVSHTDSAVTLKCKNCGHVWRSNSVAAWRKAGL